MARTSRIATPLPILSRRRGFARWKCPFPARLVTLDNGVRVVFVPDGRSRMVTVNAIVGTGSCNEPEQLQGISHFLEHSLFLGTRQRPTSHHIESEAETLGGGTNGETEYETTRFEIGIPAEFGALAMEMVFDLMFGSTFAPTALRRERAVVLQEIMADKDVPDTMVRERLYSELFRGTPLARQILGTEASVNAIRRRNLMHYRDTRYLASSIVLAVSGRISRNVLPMVRATFGRLPARRPPSQPVITLGRPGGVVCVENSRFEQLHCQIGFRSYPRRHPKGPARSLLEAIIGDGCASRFYTELRKLGVYEAGAFSAEFRHTGLLVAHAAIKRVKPHAAIGALIRIMSSIAEHGPTEDELLRAKGFLRGGFISAHEDPSFIAWDGADDVLASGSLRSPEDRLDTLLSVTKDDVRNVAQELFRCDNMAAVVLGPIKSETSLRRLFDNAFS